MKASLYLVLALVLTVCFTLATGIEPRAGAWSNRSQSDNVFSVLFGDGRRLFANQFFTMADVYFHSGYYPSIFDLREEGPKEIVAESHGHTDSPEDEIKEDFLGKPKDWIDRFGRHFRITEHTHLEHGNEREILPWLRLAADMDPQKIETYTVGSFFMREHLNQPREAEAFLREGLRNNPNSFEICSNWAGFITKIITIPIAREMSGNSPSAAGCNKIPRPKRKINSTLKKSPFNSPILKRAPATIRMPSVGFRPPRKSRPHRMPSNSRLMKSKRKWRRKPMLPLLPPTNRAIALCFSCAALV